VRTTVSIDDDVLAAARERAAREGRTLGEVLSTLARLGLTARSAEPSATEFHGFRPLPHRGRPITNAAIDKLREDEGE
jgi:hypothetical protein